MAPVNEEMHILEARADAQRAAMVTTVTEVTRRLQPRYLVDATTRLAKQKSVELFGGVSRSIKNHGGTAALLGIGAVTAFDLGRRSARGQSGTGSPYEFDSSSSNLAQPAIPASAYAGAIGRLIAGMSLGMVLGRAFKVTAAEERLLAEIAPDLPNTAAAFVQYHSRGAKLVAADAFGFARYAAAFLAIMAAVGDRFRDEGDEDTVREP
jgi:hypothetical protein